MRDHPILFTPENVRAILDGRKNQTRRVVRPQPHAGVRRDVFRGGIEDRHGRKIPIWCRPDDLLWVRESHVRPKDGSKGPVWYTADGDPPDTDWRFNKRYPSIHMPRWASRLTLVVEEVRVQRLQETSHEDMLAEGVVDVGRLPGEPWAHYEYAGYHDVVPLPCFAKAWDDLNADRGYGWDSNPWVWAITFRPVEVNIDIALQEIDRFTVTEEATS